MGAAAEFLTDTWDPSVAVLPGTDDVVVAYTAAVYTELGARLYRRRTGDGGATWDLGQEIAAGDNRQPRLAASGPQRDRVVATWIQGIGPQRRVTAAVSADGGLTFGPAVPVSDPGASALDLAWNDLYQNAIVTWADFYGTKPTYAGGLRPQAITPTGFAPGPTQLGADFEAFDDGSGLAFLLFSTAPGSFPLPLGDGRDLGLEPSQLFLDTLPLALGGTLAAALAPDGSGSLTPIPATLPSPLTVYAAGLALDLGTLSFGDISDVVRIDF